MRHTVARGTVYLMAAELTVIFSSYLIHVGLARWLGPEAYGQFGVILSVIFITKILFLTGIALGVSKYVAEQKDLASSWYRFGLRAQLIVVLACLLLFWFFSGQLAAWLADPSLEPLIRLSSGMILGLGLYSIAVKGYMNGLKMFNSQAYLEAIQSVFRIILVVLFVFIGWNLFGAIAAYILAPLLSWVVAMVMLKKQLPVNLEGHPATSKLAVDNKAVDHEIVGQKNIDKKLLFHFAWPLTLYYLFFTVTTEYGLLAVKRLLLSDLQTGLYTAAATLSKVTQSIFTALPLTLFPAVSSARGQNNPELIKKYLTQSTRYALMLVLPVAILISTHARELLSFFYSTSFVDAAPALRILAFGFAFLALFLAQGSFILGINKLKIATILAMMSALLLFLLTSVLIPKYGILGAAISTTATAATVLAVSSTYLLVKFKALISFRSTINILLASAWLYQGSAYAQFTGAWFIVSMMLWFILYLLILVVLREITADDHRLVFSLLKFKQE